MRVVGTSVEGRPIEYCVLGRGDEVVFIMGTIHGDEPACKPLVERLGSHLRSNPDLLANRRVVLMPVANPDGLERSTRENVRGVDLNRNFPAENFVSSRAHGTDPLSEPESKAIQAVLDRYRPVRVVSVHQPYGVIDYDGPGEALAHAMAAHCELPVKRVGSLPGSLGSYVGLTLGTPMITLELPESAGKLSEQQLWDAYGDVLLAAIRFPEKHLPNLTDVAGGSLTSAGE
jgi:protein MpaA